MTTPSFALLPNALARALLDRAIWTEDRLDSGLRLAIPQHEEGLTQANLLSLAEALPSLAVRMYSRRDESRRTGADWIWWWRGASHWFGGLVQAKRLLGDAIGGYYDLGYRPRRSDGTLAPRQLETLVQASQRNRVPAMFALYNCTIPNAHRSGHCPLGLQGSSAEGITCVDARLAAEVMRSRTGSRAPLDDVRSWTRPWSCLATCSSVGCAGWPHAESVIWSTFGFTVPPARNDLAAQAAYFAYMMAGTQRMAQFRDVRLDPSNDATLRYASEGVRTRPPEYVLEPEMLGQGEWNDEDDAESSPGDVGAVILIEPQAGLA